MGNHPYFGLAALLVAGTLSAPAKGEGSAPAACLESYEQAQRHRLKQALGAAHKDLLVCSKAECPEVLRRECTTWLGEVESAQPSIVVMARAGDKPVSDVTITIDGKIVAREASSSAITLDPGKHELRVESIDHDPMTLTLDIEQGEKNRRVDVDFGGTTPAPRAPERNLTPVYGLAALGALGVGSFAFFGLRSHSKKNDLESCKGHCSEDDVDSVKRDQLVADISLGLGLACLGGATYLYFSKPKQSEGLRLGVRPRTAGVHAIIEGLF